MKEIFTKFGYNNNLHKDEWRKKNWTIRFGLTEYEAFDDPGLNRPGMYFKDKIENLDLEFLLEEIEKYIKS